MTKHYRSSSAHLLNSTEKKEEESTAPIGLNTQDKFLEEALKKLKKRSCSNRHIQASASYHRRKTEKSKKDSSNKISYKVKEKGSSDIVHGEGGSGRRERSGKDSIVTPRSSVASMLTHNLFHLKEIIQGKRLVGDKKRNRNATVKRGARPRNSMF